MTTKEKIVELPISSLQVSFYVRDAKGIDDDRVYYFSELYKDKQKQLEIPPIVVNNSTMEVIDGRNRLMGAKIAHGEDSKIRCRLVDITSRPAMFIAALSANCRGPKDQTIKDFKYIIKQLIAAGVSRGQILKDVAAATGFPEKLIGVFYKDVLSAIAKQELYEAQRAVLDGDMSISAAAKQYGIEVSRLKESMGGQKKISNVAGNAKGTIISRHKDFKRSMGQLLKGVIEKYEEAEISGDDLKEIVEIYVDAADSISKLAKDWKSRVYATIVKTTNEFPFTTM